MTEETDWDLDEIEAHARDKVTSANRALDDLQLIQRFLVHVESIGVVKANVHRYENTQGEVSFTVHITVKLDSLGNDYKNTTVVGFLAENAAQEATVQYNDPEQHYSYVVSARVPIEV